MKIKCISVGFTKTLELDKIYSVKILKKNGVSLLGESMGSIYSLKKFETLDGRPLDIYVKESYLDKFKVGGMDLYESKRVRYRLTNNSYIMTYKNYRDFNKGEVFFINGIFKDKYNCTRFNIKNILNDNTISALGYDSIKRYFYQVYKDEVDFYLRTQKILKLKSKFVL